MSDNAVISFANYDSSVFASIPESVAHAANNPLLIENLSDWKTLDFDGVPTLVQDSSCLLKDMIHFFEDVVITEPLPVSEHYRPEITAKRIYDCADLWYIILIVNDIFSVTKYDPETIKYIPGTELRRLEKFTRSAKRKIRTLQEDDASEVII